MENRDRDLRPGDGYDIATAHIALFNCVNSRLLSTSSDPDEAARG